MNQSLNKKPKKITRKNVICCWNYKSNVVPQPRNGIKYTFKGKQKNQKRKSANRKVSTSWICTTHQIFLSRGLCGRVLKLRQMQGQQGRHTGHRQRRVLLRAKGAGAVVKVACRKIEFIVNSKREAANGRQPCESQALAGCWLSLQTHIHLPTHWQAHTHTPTHSSECHASYAMSRTAPKKLFSRNANFWRALSSDGRMDGFWVPPTADDL